MGAAVPPPQVLQALRQPRAPAHFPLTFDAELGETKLAVVVPQHVVEILPRQLIPVLKP